MISPLKPESSSLMYLYARSSWPGNQDSLPRKRGGWLTLTRTTVALVAMDKWGVSVGKWTSPQNARLVHFPTPPTRTCPHRLAVGLTRFACQTACEKIQ